MFTWGFVEPILGGTLISMHLASIAYVPPPKIGCAQVFLDNLRKYPPKHELILYSDHDYGPGVIKLKGSPEQVRGKTFPGSIQPNPYAINNLCFLTGMRIAAERSVSHGIYLEADCRVGRAGWDDVIFEEFFSIPRALIAAGSLVCYNPCNAGPEAARRWQKLVSRNLKRNFPIATYGFVGAAQNHASCVFPNGAGGVYDLSWMQRLFEITSPEGVRPETITAWDMALGVEVWKLFAEESYEVLGHLETIYSSYGNVLTSPEDRQNMLLSGQVVLTHQHKDNWAP